MFGCVSCFVACGDSEDDASAEVNNLPPPTPRRICDGTSDFRLLYQVPVPPQVVHSGTHMVYDNGGEFLVVRGDCRYWVFPDAPSGLADTREGSLSPEAEAQLHDALRYDEWPELRGTYGDNVSYFDTLPPPVLSDMTNHIACFSSCLEGLPELRPEAIRALFAAVETWTLELHGQGAALTGPVRAMAINQANEFREWPYPIEPWTVATPLETLEFPYTGARERGQGYSVADPDATVFREWRRKLIAGEYYNPAYTGGAFIPVSDSAGRLFGLYVRDSLPFENKNGLIPFGPYAAPP